MTMPGNVNGLGGDLGYCRINRLGLSCGSGERFPMTDRLPSEPVAECWTPATSDVLLTLRRDTRPSHQPGRRRKRQRYGVKAWRKLETRVTALEAENIALKQHLAIEVAPSLIPGVASPVPERPDQPVPLREAEASAGNSTVATIVDSRRPDPVAIEEKALAAEERHRLAALAWKKQALLWRIMADRGLGRTQWSSPYWASSPYKPGFGI
jgi:hypothetical protein